MNYLRDLQAAPVVGPLPIGVCVAPIRQISRCPPGLFAEVSTTESVFDLGQLKVSVSACTHACLYVWELQLASLLATGSPRKRGLGAC